MSNRTKHTKAAASTLWLIILSLLMTTIAVPSVPQAAGTIPPVDTPAPEADWTPDSCPPSNCTAGRDVGRDFFEGVIQRLSDVPVSDLAVDALVAWEPYENTLACWNPLATTRYKSGSCCFNSVCVRHYLNQTMGMEATAETLALSYYTHIRAMLRREAFDREGLRGDLSTWGSCSGSGCNSLLGTWQSLWDNQSSSTVVVVEDPEITPSYNGVCTSHWYRFHNNRGHDAYLTLNTDNPAYSTNTAVWRPNLPKTGRYKVEAYIASHGPIDWQCPSRHIGWDSSDARYSIYHTGGKTTVSGDQAPVDNAWLNLGTFQFNSGSGARVELTDLNDEAHLSHTVSFSAIRFTLIEETSDDNTTVVEDPNITPSYNGMCGSAWYRFSNNRGHDAYLTLNTDNPAYSTNWGEWQPNLPYSGAYKVEAYVANHPPIDWECPSRHIGWDTGDARYTVYHANGTTSVSGNQAPLDNQWLNLGVHTFHAGSSGKVQLTDLNGEPHLSHTVSFSAMRFTFQGEDTTYPWGEITWPVGNPTITDSGLDLIANAADNPGGSGIKRVRFWARYADSPHAVSEWRLVGDDSTAPYSSRWEPPDGLRSQLVEVGIHVEDNADNYCIDPSTRRDYGCYDLGSKQVFIYNEVNVIENWLAADLRAYLNQRSLANGDEKCAAASAAMVLAMNHIISNDYDSLAGEANQFYINTPDHTASTVARTLRDAYGLDMVDREYGFYERDELWADVTASINLNHPVMLLSRQFTAAYGHYVVIIGYRQQGGVREFIVYDPYGRWQGTLGEYDRNSNDRDSVKGRWVWYSLDEIWPSLGHWYHYKPYLILSQSVLSTDAISATVSDSPDTPPDMVSQEEPDLGIYQGVPIYPTRIYLPFVGKTR